MGRKIKLFDELWLIVFDFLNLKDIFQCMQISRRWHELTSLRMKSDTSLLKQWHQTEMLLAQHENVRFDACETNKYWSKSDSNSSIFLEDLGLLVMCENTSFGIPIIFQSKGKYCVKFMLSAWHYLSKCFLIYHYHKDEQKLIIHLKQKARFLKDFHYVVDLSEIKNLEPQEFQYYPTDEEDNFEGRCKQCAQIFPNKFKKLLPPSPRYYENHKGFIFVNEPKLLKVGCYNGMGLNIFENGCPVTSVNVSSHYIQLIDSEHIFDDDKIININTKEEFPVRGFDETPTLYRVGSYLLHQAADNLYREVERKGNDWSLTYSVSYKGYYPAFCSRENRILFF